MKKLLSFVLAFALVCSLTACGEFHMGSQATRPTAITPTGPVDMDSEETYKITLTKDGQPYSPEIDIYAQWTDGYSYYTAKFDKNGVAAISGLDGDYIVTLSAVPMDYTYNINGYKVTNDERQITINIQRIYYGDGSPGTGPYYPEVMQMSDLGVYQIEIEGPDDVFFCRYMPNQNGIYNIESWVSVAEDNINPKVDLYFGTVALVYYDQTVDDGGWVSESGYTKNFKFTKDVSDEEVGNVFVFAVKAVSKDGKYPITVPVSIERIGDLPQRYYSDMVVPEEVIRYAPTPNGQFKWAERETEVPGRYLFDQTMYKLWPAEEGGDGFYHLFDEEKYASTQGYGPTLYAKIDQADRYTGGSLSEVEYLGNGSKALSLQVDPTHYAWYKHFIEGYESLATFRVIDQETGMGGSVYCTGLCPCPHPESNITGCPEGCVGCDSNCVRVKPELYGAPGYANGANRDGCYPVTQELKDFLQLYAICHAYFVDGTGVVETSPDKVDADEASQWLFACGYYTGDPGGLCQMGEEVPNYFDQFKTPIP